jgi:hypothetical protein
VSAEPGIDSSGIDLFLCLQGIYPNAPAPKNHTPPPWQEDKKALVTLRTLQAEYKSLQDEVAKLEERRRELGETEGKAAEDEWLRAQGAEGEEEEEYDCYDYFAPGEELKGVDAKLEATRHMLGLVEASMKLLMSQWVEEVSMRQTEE